MAVQGVRRFRDVGHVGHGDHNGVHQFAVPIRAPVSERAFEEKLLCRQSAAYQQWTPNWTPKEL